MIAADSSIPRRRPTRIAPLVARTLPVISASFAVAPAGDHAAGFAQDDHARRDVVICAGSASEKPPGSGRWRRCTDPVRGRCRCGAYRCRLRVSGVHAAPSHIRLPMSRVPVAEGHVQERIRAARFHRIRGMGLPLRVRAARRLAPIHISFVRRAEHAAELDQLAVQLVGDGDGVERGRP